MIKFFNRVSRYIRRRVGEAGRFISETSVRRELRRLSSEPRFTPGTCCLLEKPIAYVDAASCVSAWREIWGKQSYRFVAVNERPRILDCGANIGLATLFWKTIYPHAQISAFEPDPLVFNALQKNLQTWQFSDVELIQSAVWTLAQARLPFSSDGADAGQLAVGGHAESNIISVSSVRLRDFLVSPVDLLKIDIEGAECEVIDDCQDRLSLVRNLFVEFHSFVDRTQQLDGLLRSLRNAGFRVHFTCGLVSSQPFLERRVYNGMDQFINIYAYRPDASVAGGA